MSSALVLIGSSSRWQNFLRLKWIWWWKLLSLVPKLHNRALNFGTLSRSIKEIIEQNFLNVDCNVRHFTKPYSDLVHWKLALKCLGNIWDHFFYFCVQYLVGQKYWVKEEDNLFEIRLISGEKNKWNILREIFWVVNIRDNGWDLLSKRNGVGNTTRNHEMSWPPTWLKKSYYVSFHIKTTL